jgi:hypothetical protein
MRQVRVHWLCPALSPLRTECGMEFFLRYGLSKTGMTSLRLRSVHFTPLGCIKAGPFGLGFLLPKEYFRRDSCFYSVTFNTISIKSTELPPTIILKVPGSTTLCISRSRKESSSDPRVNSTV